MSTYVQVTKEVGLSGITARRYISYMSKRWASTEDQKCRDGYATEWAMRFKQGIEYGASDSTGTSILREMDALGDY